MRNCTHECISCFAFLGVCAVYCNISQNVQLNNKHFIRVFIMSTSWVAISKTILTFLFKHNN